VVQSKVDDAKLKLQAQAKVAQDSVQRELQRKQQELQAKAQQEVEKKRLELESKAKQGLNNLIFGKPKAKPATPPTPQSTEPVKADSTKNR